jgi:hypothetical protein
MHTSTDARMRTLSLTHSRARTRRRADSHRRCVARFARSAAQMCFDCDGRYGVLCDGVLCDGALTEEPAAGRSPFIWTPRASWQSLPRSAAAANHQPPTPPPPPPPHFAPRHPMPCPLLGYRSVHSQGIRSPRCMLYRCMLYRCATHLSGSCDASKAAGDPLSAVRSVLPRRPAHAAAQHRTSCTGRAAWCMRRVRAACMCRTSCGVSHCVLCCTVYAVLWAVGRRTHCRMARPRGDGRRNACDVNRSRSTTQRTATRRTRSKR